MKKLLFTWLALVAFLPLFAQKDSLAVKGYHPYDTIQNAHVARRNANWSIIPHIGFNVFDGDFNSEMKHPVSFPSAGLDIEYDFTPVFGLGVEYMYGRYGARGKAGHADTLLCGNLHRASGYISVDLIGLFYPHDKRKIVGLDAMFGGGYAWYKTWAMYHDDRNSSVNPVRNPTHVKGETASYVNADGLVGRPDYMTKFKGTPFLQFAVNLEFNLNRTLALGVRANYNYFLTDAIDGRGYAGDAGVASKNNDGLLDVTLNLRIKLIGKERSHVRNMGGEESNPIIAQRLAALEQNPDALAVRDTVVVIQRDTIVEIREVQSQPAVAQVAERPHTQTRYYIYFPSGKTKLSDEGLATVQQVADVMKTDESLYAVVTGYCDNTGSDKTNYRLGDQRAENVIDELIQEYDIPADHVYAGGIGRVVGKRSAAGYGPNRRAVIQLVDEETFRKLSFELDDKRAKRGAKPENAYTDRPAEKVSVENNATLSRLARKHYNNTYCWVYIYMANPKLKNPNQLCPGEQLRIPELTKEELAINKEQSVRILESYVRQK